MNKMEAAIYLGFIRDMLDDAKENVMKDKILEALDEARDLLVTEGTKEFVTFLTRLSDDKGDEDGN